MWERDRNTIRSTPNSLVRVREAEDAEITPKRNEDPPPACFCMRGKWMKRERRRNRMVHGGALSKYIVLVIRNMAWARYWCNDMRRVRRWLRVVSTLRLSATGGKGRTLDTNHKWFVFLRTCRGSHNVYFSSFFIPTPNPYACPNCETHCRRNWMAYIPRWRGEAW
jgi:hypothetical protein